MIDEFTDVNDGEKALMKLWNGHVIKIKSVNIRPDKLTNTDIEILFAAHTQTSTFHSFAGISS